MGYVLIIHEVNDFSEWKIGFDRAASLRKDAGELEYQVLQFENDANRVVHYSKWQSLEKAKEFFESDEVQKIREKLGVKKPEFIYLKQNESGIL